MNEADLGTEVRQDTFSVQHKLSLTFYIIEKYDTTSDGSLRITGSSALLNGYCFMLNPSLGPNE